MKADSALRAFIGAQLRRLLGQLGDGDILMVTLDRLARSTHDLLNTLDAVTKAGAAFRSLADTWADTTTPHGRLILTVLGGLAEFERKLIRARICEGRERAKARGVHMGRPPKLNPAPAAGGVTPPGGRGDDAGTGPAVQCVAQYDFKASQMKALL